MGDGGRGRPLDRLRLTEPADPHAPEAGASGPLRGVKVLDLTAVVFGPYATQLLGDLGAEVIKIEAPADDGRSGDVMRWAGAGPQDGPAGLGPIYMTLNRNKRSAMLDLRRPEDLAVVRALAAECDVFVSTIRYDGLARLGLDYEAVRGLRPDVVYAHGSGFGSDGPYAGRPAYDDLIQAASGAADLLPRADGDGRPRYLPTLLADKVAGLLMAQAILAALFHRQRTGEGQFVETPMFEGVTGFLLAEHLFGHAWDPPTGPYAYPRVATPHRKPFPTRDGHIGMLPYSDRDWRAFFALAGWEETVARDPRFADPAARARHIGELYALVDAVTATRTTAEWLELLQARGVPAVALNRLDELEHDPHLRAVGFFERREHPEGAWVALRPPWRFSATPAAIRREPPTLGEHTDEVRAEAARLQPRGD